MPVLTPTCRPTLVCRCHPSCLCPRCAAARPFPPVAHRDDVVELLVDLRRRQVTVPAAADWFAARGDLAAADCLRCWQATAPNADRDAVVRDLVNVSRRVCDAVAHEAIGRVPHADITRLVEERLRATHPQLGGTRIARWRRVNVDVTPYSVRFDGLRLAPFFVPLAFLDLTAVTDHRVDALVGVMVGRSWWNGVVGVVEPRHVTPTVRGLARPRFACA